MVFSRDFFFPSEDVDWGKVAHAGMYVSMCIMYIYMHVGLTIPR